jgi:AcrR family transcriptional regulator
MTRRSAGNTDVDAVEVTGNDGVDGRRARSLRTSSRVLAASRDLFLEHGYARTSMEAIAAEAGVSAQTVYNQFGTKCDLLAAVLDQAIVGDADGVAVMDRPWFVVDDGEQAADAIARFAATGTAILARVAPIYDVIRSASALPEVRRLLAGNRRRRRADQRKLVRGLVATGQLREDFDAEHVADVVYGLANEDVYLLLTGDCRWSRKRFTTWLAGTLLDQLVTPSRAQRLPATAPTARRAASSGR